MTNRAAVLPKNGNGSFIVSPRAAGAFIGSLAVALILGLINIVGLVRMESGEAYKASLQVMERERALLKNQIDENTRDITEHEDIKWHGDVGVELREHRIRIMALEHKLSNARRYQGPEE